MELPEVTFFEDFYFWFNTDTKKEYYATPLYFYKTSFDLDNIKSLDKYTYSERFAVYLIKRMGKLYTYYENKYLLCYT